MRLQTKKEAKGAQIKRGHKKEKGQKKKAQKKEKMREKERRDHATILFPHLCFKEAP